MYYECNIFHDGDICDEIHWKTLQEHGTIQLRGVQLYNNWYIKCFNMYLRQDTCFVYDNIHVDRFLVDGRKFDERRLCR